MDGHLRGEMNLSSIQRGPFQSCHAGYWIDGAVAGRGYAPEALVLVIQFAFESLRLHRVQVSIVPRNAPSLRVVQKLGLRQEGLSERYLEVDGVWEDHYHFAITAEEWLLRADELLTAWVREERGRHPRPAGSRQLASPRLAGADLVGRGGRLSARISSRRAAG